MNKLSAALLVLFVLLGAATWYFVNNSNSKSTLTRTDKDFRISEDEIYKIFLADRANNRITLSRVGHGKDWILDDRYPVSKSVLKNTMEVLTTVEVKYVPPRAAVKNAAKDLAVNGIKVEIYGQNDIPLRTFYIGGTTSDGHGTYFIMEGSEQPYVMQIPGFIGEIKPRFPMNPDEWRDKSVFYEKPENISSVSVEYPQAKLSSFKIGKEGASYSVLPFYDAVPRLNREVNQNIVRSYLTAYEQMLAEGIDNRNAARDSISKTLPFAIVKLKNQQNRELTVSIFPIIEKDEYGRPIQRKKPDRYFAETSDGDFFLIQDVVFRKLFFDYKAFFDN